MRKLMVTLCATSLAACAVGPDYHRPEGIAGAPLPGAFANAGVAVAGSETEAHFWQAFNDAQLSQLVSDALAANNDVHIAYANVSAARAAHSLSRYDLFPTVDAAADYEKSLASHNQFPGYSHDQRRATNVDAGFDALWELDFYGRVRREVEQSRANAAAAEADLRNAQVSVSAEVVRDYLLLRGLQQQVSVAQANADNQYKSLQLTQVRLQAGRGNELDTSRAEAQMRTTLATIPPLQASIGQTIYALSVLCGRAPDSLTATLSVPQPMPALPTLGTIGTPEALLRRRPDVQAAEHSLQAATAGIGVAVGDLFPKVTILGSIGYNANTIGGLGSGGSEIYAYGPSISWAAFDLGRVAARIHAARANTDASLAGYQKTVLGALQETESSLLAYGRAQERGAMLELATAASDRAASLARQRFEGGLTDFLDVLDAQRDALAAETSLVQSRTETATDLIAVYKALGGAWEGLDESPQDTGLAGPGAAPAAPAAAPAATDATPAPAPAQ